MTDALKIAEKENVQSIVTSPFLLRVGGLPIDVVDELSFAKTASWAEGVLSLENMLASRKEKLADALHEAVSKHKEDRVVRRKLINLRRDIFNMRALDNIAEIKALAEMLTSPERELLLEWIHLWAKYRYLLDAGQELFVQELSQKRARLKQVIEIADFRKGLALASPLLDSAIDAYLASDDLQLNRSSRTVERSLVEYLLRTACKTSPFSTFTTVCPGTFDYQPNKADPDIVYQIEDLEKKSFTQLSIVILSRLSSFIIASPQIRPELLVSLTPGWHVLNGRIRYLRRIQGVEDGTDEIASPLMDPVHENVFYLPVGHLLQTLIDLIGDGRKIRFHELVSQLANLSGDQKSESQEQVRAYLEHLLRLGLLIVPDLELNLHSKYLLASYRQGLLALGIPALEQVAGYLASLEALVKAYAAASAGRRGELLVEIRQQVRACYAELEQAHASLPQTLLYEDTTLRPQKLAINTTGWQGILSSVAEFQQILPLLDINLPKRLATRGYFQARYGAGQRCEDFLSFAYEFRQRFFEHYLKNAMTPVSEVAGKKKFPLYLNYFHQAEIASLEHAQQALTDFVEQAYRSLPPGARELTLGDDFIESLTPYVPKSAPRLSSYAFFSHFTRINGEATLVVNRIYTGLTLMFSRFGHFFDKEEGYQLVHELRNALQSLQPVDAVFAELKGGYDTTNLNLHPQVTPYELVCPGDLSSRPADEQILLEDLAIQDVEEEGRLRLYAKSLGKEVIPVYLGFLLPMALPEIQQVLLNFTIAPMCQIGFWKGVSVDEDGEGVRVYPRLKYKDMVLHREHWQFPQGLFPQRVAGQSDADFFLTVTRWRKKHRIPSRVFVTSRSAFDIAAPDPAHANMEAAPGSQMRTHKPLYVDFENYFSLALLEATVRSFTNGLVITEMLPQRDQLWFQHKSRSYVSEFVWEMNTLRGDIHG